jgi:hypothetical protein
MIQNLCIVQDDDVLGDFGLIKAITDITHEVVFQSASASKVIQWAIDALDGEGGEIKINRGEYSLDEVVRLGDNVWLRGSGRGTKLLVKGASGLLGKGVKGVEISNLGVIAADDKANAGIILDSCGDSKIRDVLAVGFTGYGIWMRNNTFLSEVRGCSLAGNHMANLYIDHLERGDHGDFIPNLVSNCMIYGGGKGIDIERAIVLNVIGCVAYQTGDVAYHIHNTSNSVLISGCRSFQITGPAVAVEDTHEFNLSSNVFCWHTEEGVRLKNCNWGTITGNEIIDTGSYNPGTRDTTTKFSDIKTNIPLYDGISLENCQGFTINGNAVFNWPVCPKIDVGIRLDTGCFKNNIVGNNVNYYETADVLSEGEETVVANNVGYSEKPFQSAEAVGTTIQSFYTKLTDDFIADVMGNVNQK